MSREDHPSQPDEPDISVEDADVQDMRTVVESIAKRQGHEHPLPLGYLLACEYLDDDGTRTWSLRYDPDMGLGSMLGLAKIVQMDTDEEARRVIGLDDE